MKKLIVSLVVLGFAFATLFIGNRESSAQKNDGALQTDKTEEMETQQEIREWPSLERQLTQKYFEFKVSPNTELEKLIRENQDFSMLRQDEMNDKRGLPPWIRVWWRKQHPEMDYSADDPTGGYPLVLKEILEWMLTHQDLKRGPGMEAVNKLEASIETTFGANLRVSGAQTVPRSESDIRINYFDTQKILVGSNNISGGGRQGMYYSTDGGTSWNQTLLPFTASDTTHSDPTTEWTSDGRAWSSTLGIQGGTLRLRNYFSTDNGATWTFEATPSGTQTSVDKQMVWADHSPTSPFFGRIYATWHNGAPAFVNRRTAGASGTWLAAPFQVSGSESTGTAIGGDVKTNSAGDVFVFWPTTGNRRIIVTKSTNGGDSFGTPIQIATTFDGFDIGVPSFNNRRAFIYVAGGAYRTATKNNVYASWTDLSGETGCTAAANEPGSNVNSTCKMRVWFSRSTDGGATWSPAVKINNPANLNDQFNQWLVVDETNGVIHIAYNDTIGDSGRKKSDIWFQSSNDDGVTWSSPQKVTTAMTDETIAGANLGNQYGDYNGLSGYANVIFPSWTDRRDNLREEIWTAKINYSFIAKSPFDFDGDGKTDVSIFRPSVGQWWYQQSSDNVTKAFAFGTETDKLVPGDYDGDEKADVAIWRPATGEWFVLRSSNLTFFSAPFGTNGDIPVAGDFDGDAKTDFAVYRPSVSTWFVNKSSGGIDFTVFGATGDIPVVGDYDGDSKADYAIFRPMGGSGSAEWWMVRSTAGLFATPFGSATDKPIPGDYTGDRKADIAFFRPSTSNWFVLRSEDLSFFAVPFGATGDIPLSGDFDGDGKYDFAIFRPASATWFVQKSSGGVDIQGYGTTGDKPVPSAFVP